MKMMFDILDNICDKLINVTNREIKQSETLEVRDLARKFTSDVIGNVAFGLDFNCKLDGVNKIDPRGGGQMKFIYLIQICLQVLKIPTQSS